jgi:GGDEF domain-containing protein
VRDDLTGIYDSDFTRETLELRVTAARRFLRPLALVLFQADAAASNDVSEATTMTLREVDVLGRDAETGAYALVLEDTSDTGAVEAVTRLRDRLERFRGGGRFVAAVACYPTQGIEPFELLDRARAALFIARASGGDCIEVA